MLEALCDVVRRVAETEVMPRYQKVTFNRKFDGSLLTEADVAAIRRDRRVQREIAQQYGVSQSLIQQLQSNKGWNHVC